MNLKKHLYLLSVMVVFVLVSAKIEQTKNILVIGDSISIGYTPFIQKALAPNAVVEHNPGNGGSTERGRDKVESWIENKEWDVILFNFGLHDMVYLDSAKKYDAVNGKIAVPLNEYKDNLQLIINKLKQTTSRLIFINTTMVPENALGRKINDPVAYNKAALEVMKKNGIDVIDLYTASLTIHPQNSSSGNVHYTDAGYAQLADVIITKIKSVIN